MVEASRPTPGTAGGFRLPAESTIGERQTGVGVAVLLPTLYRVRNVLHGLLRALTEAGLRAPRSFRGNAGGGLRNSSGGGALRSPFGASPRALRRGRAFLNGVIAEAFSHRHPKMSYELYRTWFRRHGTVADPVRTTLLETLGRMAASGGMLDFLQRAAERHYRRRWDLEPVRRRLRELDPKLLWSTTCTSRFEFPYILAARDLKR